MDTPSNGGRDSRFNLNSYDMPILAGESASEIYNSNILHNRPTSITSGLSRSMNNSCTSGALSRGIKRTSSEMCYDQNMQNRSMMNVNDCNSDIMEDSYSPNHQKNSPLSNGKKTKGRVKIKMEYIDNKLRRYTTFSKRKTGIMKKAYELSTLTGTQVMLLVASETGHVYTFATRKLQPMITSESGKNLIQMCLNSPDPCPSGSGDQRMSATGFEETELSYNVGDDDKVDSSSCSPYRSDSSDSSEVESVSGSPPSSPPPLISLQDLQSSSSTTPATKVENGMRCIPLNSFRQGKKITASSSSSPSGTPTVHFVDVNSLETDAEKNAAAAYVI
ncbi:serum response factor homolog isoform X2 [Planococcus citri]|uniref:serum response factor homolog isoform X2 n=1 Tax=Planococcus citri TaxID=170843 RepID=UPI0031F81E33